MRGRCAGGPHLLGLRVDTDIVNVDHVVLGVDACAWGIARQLHAHATHATHARRRTSTSAHAHVHTLTHAAGAPPTTGCGEVSSGRRTRQGDRGRGMRRSALRYPVSPHETGDWVGGRPRMAAILDGQYATQHGLCSDTMARITPDCAPPHRSTPHTIGCNACRSAGAHPCSRTHGESARAMRGSPVANGLSIRGDPGHRVG